MSEFTTPDCVVCGCVQDGHCLCIPSKPAANPEFKAYGSARMRFVESDEKADIREANDYLHDHGYNSLKRTNGYYTDCMQHDTCVPVVLIVTTTCVDCRGAGAIGDGEDSDDCQNCDAEGMTYVYTPGVRGPNDDKSAGCFDFEHECDDSADAAKAAHALAERYAESEREHDATFQCESQIEGALDSIRSARSQHSAIVREMVAGAMSQDEATTPAVYAALAAQRDGLRASVHADVRRIKLLRDEPWRAVEY